MCAEEFAEFPEPTTCIISTVKPCQFHESPVVLTAVSTDSVQLQSSYRLAAVHDPCYTSTSNVAFMCAEECEDFPDPTSCISLIVRSIRLHEPSIAQLTTQVPNEVFQLCPLVTRTQAKAFCRMPDLQSPPKVTCSTQWSTPFHRCQVSTLAASCLSLDQRKQRSCGSAYLGLHQFTPPKMYRLSCFEAGRRLNVHDLFIIFTYILLLNSLTGLLIIFALDHLSYLLDWFIMYSYPI